MRVVKGKPVFYMPPELKEARALFVAKLKPFAPPKPWKCPIMFYTGTKYDSDQYGEMVKTAIKLHEKWGFALINLWDSEEMNAVSKEDYASYMADPIHPSRTGYIEWWTPAFETAITEYLSSVK